MLSFGGMFSGHVWLIRDTGGERRCDFNDTGFSGQNRRRRLGFLCNLAMANLTGAASDIHQFTAGRFEVSCHVVNGSLSRWCCLSLSAVALDVRLHDGDRLDRFIGGRAFVVNSHRGGLWEASGHGWNKARCRKRCV